MFIDSEPYPKVYLLILLFNHRLLRRDCSTSKLGFWNDQGVDGMTTGRSEAVGFRRKRSEVESDRFSHEKTESSKYQGFQRIINGGLVAVPRIERGTRGL